MTTPQIRREQTRLRVQKYRASHGKRDRTNEKRTHVSVTKPFIGVDGEGGGTDAAGRQLYKLLCAGEAELFNNNEQLSTADCLEFILSLSSNAILIGYYFTYDVTMILRDLPTERLERLYTKDETQKSFYTFFGEYAIQFIPRQYFRVARLNRDTLKAIPGTARTINEVGGFFQKSFVEALRDRKIGDPATIEFIGANKDRRSEFDIIGTTERQYCALECKLLAELTESLRADCIAADIVPRNWRGAGSLASRLHEMNNTIRRKDRDRWQTLDRMAIEAYYGGRFEIAAVGRIPGPIYEYDIRSAYPAAMLKLPCPIHTKWRKFNGAIPAKDALSLFVARVHFRHGAETPICGFPIREKGKLYWPIEGNGIYWSPEIQKAVAAGSQVSYESGYYASTHCDCCNYEWVERLYQYRKQIGSATRGYPIKLGLNALYGKLAQREGAAPWRDQLAAGLITAYTRAALQDACNRDPDAIVMLATDAVFSRRPLDLPIGDDLGQWETKIRETGLFIVQPGIYWSPGSEHLPKTRGIPRSKVIAERQRFEDIWDHWCIATGAPPAINVGLTNFIGHRLALARNKPELAGTWLPVTKRISFDWANKRQPAAALDGAMLRTVPYRGAPDLVSESFDPKLLTELSDQLLDDEAAPDYFPWGNSVE